ncbi:MAG: translation initiation factor IF-2 N-terminal domain-containing protein [Campylobacteraceae bacterium]
MVDKVKISDIAKELGLKSKDVIEKAIALGIDIKLTSSISLQLAERLANYIITGVDSNPNSKKNSQTISIHIQNTKFRMEFSIQIWNLCNNWRKWLRKIYIYYIFSKISSTINII